MMKHMLIFALALGAVAGKSIHSCVSGDICLETTMTWWELEKGEKCTEPVSNKSCAEQGYTYRMDFIKPECNRNPIKGVPECLNAILLHKAKGPAGERLDPCCATYLLGDWMRVVYAPFGLSLWMNSKPPWMAPNTTTALLSRFAPLLIKMVTLSTAPAAESQLYPTPTGKTQINDQNLIDAYNAANDATWVAGHNDFFDGMTFDDARPLLGTALSHISDHLNKTLADSVYAAIGEPPADFDARTQWSGLIHPIRNQKHCGSCWAFSAAEVLSDRVAIATRKASPSLSPEDMVSCDKSDMGCRGGWLSKAWSYLENTGIVTDKCFPYAAGDGTAPACPTKCADGGPLTKQKASSVFAIRGLTNMQKELATNGPIQVAFLVYRSFFSYKSGVYAKKSYEYFPEGGHAVKLIGWGTENGNTYWLIANSWGATWGLDGLFKIKRGINECGIETQGPPYAGLPATSHPVVVV